MVKTGVFQQALSRLFHLIWLEMFEVYASKSKPRQVSPRSHAELDPMNDSAVTQATLDLTDTPR